MNETSKQTVDASRPPGSPGKWLWPGIFPLGELSVLTGDFGVGKGWLTCDMAARVSTGSPWPDGTPCPTGRVLLVNADDNAADTIRPRLDLCGADVTRVHHLNRRDGSPALPDAPGFPFMPADTPTLTWAVQRLIGVRLVVVDPAIAYLADGDDAAGVASLLDLARRTGTAVVVVTDRVRPKSLLGLAAACVRRLVHDPNDSTVRVLLSPRDRGRPDPAFTIVGEPAAVRWEAHDAIVPGTAVVPFTTGRPRRGRATRR